MVDFGRNAPPIAVVLASLILWVSFAWGLPADVPADEGDADVASAEGAWNCNRCGTANDASANYCMECGARRVSEAKVAAEDPWAGVKISDAYDELGCLYCREYNELTAARCRSCGHEFPQPSGEYTYPPWVFVPGKGFYREGTLVEPAKKRWGLIITGYALVATGPAVMIVDWPGLLTGGLVLLITGGVGALLLVSGYTTRREAVYALTHRRASYTYARRPPDSDGAALKVEVTLLSF